MDILLDCETKQETEDGQTNISLGATSSSSSRVSFNSFYIVPIIQSHSPHIINIFILEYKLSIMANID